jgi:hypothetical protein
MRSLGLRLVGSILLIAAGILLLLGYAGVIPDILPYLWIVLFAISGVFFVIIYAMDRSHWWALLPGFTLLGLGATSIVAVTNADSLSDLGGAIFLGGVALGFWLVYILHREHWWAIIPAGVLTTLAVLAQIGTGEYTIFLIGLGATFLLVFLLPSPGGRQTWALIPAAILLVLGIVLRTPYIEALDYIGAAALIIGGGYFLYRTLQKPSSASEE